MSKRTKWNNRVRKKFNAPLDYKVPVFAKNDPIEEMYGLVEPGDALLSVSWSNGRAYKLRYGYPFTHYAQVCNNLQLSEALKGGVTLTRFDKYWKSSFAILRWNGIAPEQQQIIVNTALDLVGIPYDWGELSWLLGQGLISVAAGPVALTGRVGLALGMKFLSRLMMKFNPLDKRTELICTDVGAKGALKAGLPIHEFKVGKGCYAPAMWAMRPSLLSWIAIRHCKNGPQD